jgi:Ca2+/Na+ antiporter
VDKGTVVLKTNFKGLIGELVKKLFVVLLVVAVCVAAGKLRLYVIDKFNITGNIFKGEILGIISMILVYIVLAILGILLLIALYKFLVLFYELARVTTIDFEREKIIVKKYDFPFDKEVVEKKFNRIVGVEISQKSVDRAVNSGNLYVEYLVQSKNDSKLRGIEIPYVVYPLSIKDRLMEAN